MMTRQLPFYKNVKSACDYLSLEKGNLLWNEGAVVLHNLSSF
jgi:hypothetical protein